MFSRALLSYTLAAAAGLSASLFVSVADAQPTTAPSTVPAPAAATVPMRFAVLDTRHVILNSEEGLRVQANLRKLTESKQAELAQKDRELTEEQEKLRQEEKTKGSSPGLDKRKGDWRQKVAALQQAQLDFQRDMLQKEGELTKPMVQKIGNIVKNIAQQESYDLVVDKNAVVFFRNDLDITERVLTLYNQGTAGAAPAPKKAPAKAPAKSAPGGAKKPR